MPNTNTTYSPFNTPDSVCRLSTIPADTFELCPPESYHLPAIPLNSNEDILGDLLFTLSFMIIFAFIRLRGKDLFNNLLNVLIKRKKAEIILNEGISPNLIFYILSLFLSFSVLTAGISFFVWHDFLTLNSLYIFAGLIFFHFFLLIIVRCLGWTFYAKPTADEVIINIWTYHIMSGLLISPLVISLFFIRDFAIILLGKIVIFSLAILLIVKFVRWIEILFSHRVSILYMILYLCALEIMPLLVLYKLVA